MPVAGLFLGFAGECPRCNQQADFALLDENPQQTTDDIDGDCRGRIMLDLYFQLRGGRAERVSVGDNIDAAILAFRGDERRVVTHCPQQGGDQILKLVGVLFDDILPNAFRCLTLQHIQIIGLIRILLDDRYRVLFLYLGKLAVKIGEELSGSGGKSFRTRFDRELIGFGYTSAEVLADVYAFGREQTVRVVLRQGQRKQIWQNGVKKTAAELAGNFAAVLFCPDDLNIIRDGPAARRRMMDMAISQLRPKYGALLAEYSRLYDQKSAILRDWHEKPSLLDTLDDFSDQMCRVSAKLIRYRAAYASRLNIAAAPIHADFSGGRDKLTLAYRTVSTVTDALGTEKEIYYALCDHQEQHRRAELDSGQCLTGAHKDDLLIDINGQPARAFASQGQTRTAALSLKLAEREIFHDEFDEYPVLMLDDVLSELDAQRQAFVLNRIGGGQTLITCCEDARIAERTGGRVLTVQNGGIR